MKKIVSIGAAGIVLFAIASWLFISGHLIWVSSPESVLVVKSGCNSTFVNRYNSAIQQGITDGVLESPGQSQLETVIGDIKKISGYQNDATCQTLILLIAIRTNEYSKASEAYTALKKLNSQKVYPNNNVIGGVSLSAYEAQLKLLKNPKGTSE